MTQPNTNELRERNKPCPALRYDIPDRKEKCFITGTECHYLCKENCLDYRNYVERPSYPKIMEIRRRR